MSRTDPPHTRTSPQDVRRKNFTVRLRGPDQDEVRFFLAGLADDLEGIKAQLATLTLKNDSLFLFLPLGNATFLLAIITDFAWIASVAVRAATDHY
jgi:DivIVA domain-containing protein